MKSGIKTLASWLVILMLILLGLHTVLNNPDMQMPYSKLISSIANNEVKRIEISSDKTVAYVTLKGAEATEMIVMGFIEPFAKELPMEYAVELNQLIKLEMKDSIG